MPSPESRPPRVAPQLPPMTETTTVSYRHEVNPALATNLLNDLQVAIAQQQRQLRRVVQQVKELYAEGPVVDGWLESSSDRTNSPQSASPQSSTSSATAVDPSVLFRHGDVEELMAYVQAMDTPDLSSGAPTPENATDTPSQLATTTPTYYLCQLDSSGQVRSQPCPPEQVPTVSMAIVRHQKLVKLVAQKTTIEAKLKQVVETLGDLRMLLG